MPRLRGGATAKEKKAMAWTKRPMLAALGASDPWFAAAAYGQRDEKSRRMHLDES